MFDRLFMQVLDLSKSASIVMIVVMLCRLMLKKAPKVFSYALWSVVLVRLLCPISIQSSFAIVPEIPSVSNSYTLAEESISILGAGEAAYQAVSDALTGGSGIQQIRTEETTDSGQQKYISTSNANVWILFGKYIWAAGMVLMLLYAGVSYLKLRQKLQITIPVQGNIFIADDIPSPFVIGIFRPKIYLPGNLTEQEKAYIILHEQHHIRRFDHFVKLLAFFTLTVHWFNPLVWIAFVLSGKDMEMSCDEAVIRTLGESVRADYAASLLSFATGHRIIAGTPLAFGEGNPKDRIHNLARWKRPTLWVLVILLVLCLILGAALLTNRKTGGGEQAGFAEYHGTVTMVGDSSLQMLLPDGSIVQLNYREDLVLPENLLSLDIIAQTRPANHGVDRVLYQIQPQQQTDYETIEEAVQAAILQRHSEEGRTDILDCASFYTLASDSNGVMGRKGSNCVVKYGIVAHNAYQFDGTTLREAGGCHIPTVLTFFRNDDGRYTLCEYWEPRDGSYYADDIKAKFPLFVRPDTQDHGYELERDCLEQAMEGFDIGMDVVVDYLISEICTFHQWADSWDSMLQMAMQERELLASYGEQTLYACFEAFTDGISDELRAQVMAEVCREILANLGETSWIDWDASQSGQLWYDTFASTAQKNQEMLTAQEEAHAEYPGQWLYLKWSGQITQMPDWGISFQVEQATPDGLTLLCIADEKLRAGEQFYGSEFFLEKFENGRWNSVPTLIEKPVWTTQAFLISRGETVRLNIHWSNLYGTLEPGQYRIGKGITNRQTLGTVEYATFYGDFTILESS